MTEFEKRLACVIGADGTIARGYMIEKCEFNGVNEYIITWKIPLQGAAKTNFAATIGCVMDEQVSPGLITVGLFLVILFNVNPFPYVRSGADMLGLGQLVDRKSIV